MLGRSVLLGAAIVPAMSLCLVAGCKTKGSDPMTTPSSPSSSSRTPPPPPPSLADLGRELGVVFPPGTRLIGVERENGMDDLVSAKVEMKRADWPTFLASTPIHPASFRPGNRGLLGPDKGFWDPTHYPALRSAQAQVPDHRALNIAFDDSASDPGAVFVVNHGT
jgi:hypothetical protein